MKILIPHDGSRFARGAVDFVASRATLTTQATEAWLLNVQQMPFMRTPTALSREKIQAFCREQAKRLLAPASRRLEKAAIVARPLCVTGEPGPSIARMARNKRVDLVVMGSHGRSAVAGVLLGSVTTSVLAHGTTPVLLIRGAAAPTGASLRVGIAVDGSPFGEAAVKYVLKHRALFGAQPKFALIHVAAELPYQLQTLLQNIADPRFNHEHVRTLRRRAFERAVKPARRLLAQAGIAAEEIERTGNAGDEIAAYAHKYLDVLVMGSHGRGLFKSAVLGSVATRVAARCTTPLLLIRKA